MASYIGAPTDKLIAESNTYKELATLKIAYLKLLISPLIIKNELYSFPSVSPFY